MKYASVTKHRRNQSIRNYQLRHPEVSQEEIGLKFGLSKQRIQKILSKRTCHNCYHYDPKTTFCGCRDPSDQIELFCPDWFRVENNPCKILARFSANSITSKQAVVAGGQQIVHAPDTKHPPSISPSL